MLNPRIERILHNLCIRLNVLEHEHALSTTAEQSDQKKKAPPYLPPHKREKIIQPAQEPVDEFSTEPEPIRKKKYDVHKKVMEKIMKKNDTYWSGLLGVKVHFEIAPEDLSYGTLNDVALFRNAHLSKFFINPPVVVDAFAGIGLDAISFLYNLFQKGDQNLQKIYVVENNDDPKRNERLMHNVNQYFRVVSDQKTIKDSEPSVAKDRNLVPKPTDFIDLRRKTPADVVSFHLTGTELFFQTCTLPYIDFLYIDPPWTLPPPYKNSGARGEATPTELLGFLYKTIFSHLIEFQIHVRIVCIKTRFNWEQCAPFLEILREHISQPDERYTHEVTVENTPFTGKFFFHVIKTFKADYATYKRGHWFNYVYNEDLEHPKDSVAEYNQEPQRYDAPTANDPEYRKWRPRDEMPRQTQAAYDISHEKIPKIMNF